MVDKFKIVDWVDVKKDIKQLSEFGPARKIGPEDLGRIINIVDKHHVVVGYSLVSFLSVRDMAFFIFKRKNLFQKLLSWTPFKQ